MKTMKYLKPISSVVRHIFRICRNLVNTIIAGICIYKSIIMQVLLKLHTVVRSMYKQHTITIIKSSFFGMLEG